MRLAMMERILVMGTSSPNCWVPPAALAGAVVAAADCTAERDAWTAVLLPVPGLAAIWLAVWLGLCCGDCAAAAMPGVVGLRGSGLACGLA